MSAVLINMFGMGMILGYPSSLLPALNHPDSPFKVDLDSASWLGNYVYVKFNSLALYLLTILTRTFVMILKLLSIISSLFF